MANTKNTKSAVVQAFRNMDDDRPRSGSVGGRSTLEGRSYANKDMANSIMRRLSNILEHLHNGPTDDEDGMMKDGMMKDSNPSGLLGHIEKTGDLLDECIRLLNNIEGVIGIEPSVKCAG